MNTIHNCFYFPYQLLLLHLTFADPHVQPLISISVFTRPLINFILHHINLFYPHSHFHFHTHSLTHSLTLSLTLSLTQTLTHTLTHSHTLLHTGIIASFNKRYITLAPVAGCIGLAFSLKDPNGLLKGVGSEGISIALLVS